MMLSKAISGEPVERRLARIRCDAQLKLLSFQPHGALVRPTPPTLGVLVVFQVLRQVSNYVVTRPARETLYTVVSREDKYKAKSLIDAFVYRAGDQVGAWSYSLMGWLGLSMAGIVFTAAPLGALRAPS